MLVAYDPYVGTVGKWPAIEIIERVAAAGFEGITFALKPGFAPLDEPAAIAAAEAALREHGLRVASVYCNLVTGTVPATRAQTVDAFRRALEVANPNGCSVIGMWPHVPEGTAIADTQNSLAATLEEMLPLAEEAGCVVALEFTRAAALRGYEEAIEFVAQCAPQLRLAADTTHIWLDTPDLHAAVCALGPTVAEVHLSGSHRGEPGSPGDEIDYDGFCCGLRDIGYKGNLILQYQMEDPESMARTCQLAQRLRSRWFGESAAG